MGKKSGPAAPAAPDPMKTAQAQGQVNKETAIAQANLNRIDQYTPEGSLTYQQTGTNADGTPRYSQTMQYSAGEQAKYDQANKIALELGGLAGDNISRVAEAQSKPFTYDGMTPMTTSIGGGLPDIKYGSGTGYSTQGSIGPQGQVRDLADGAGGDITKGLDYSGLTKLPGTDDFSADARRVADSVYNQATSRLDPNFQQRESDTRSRLAAQGISENSDAYRRELDNFGRDRNDAYNQATYSAQQAGANEQSRLFGLSLNARQQGQNEVNTQGQFANSAQQQGYSQQANTVQQNNQSQDQRYSQALAAAELFNNSQNQRFAQDQTAIGTNNAAVGQAFNQEGANAALGNQGRQQQITEAAYLRNLPLNDIAALMAGTQVNAPQFGNVAQVGVAAPDYQGLVTNNFNQAMSKYNTDQQNRSAGLGGLFGLAGSVAGAISDIRFKADIKRIGQLANGIATYTFRYIGDTMTRFGVMAQEVLTQKPEAVGMLPNGTLYVDYSKVY